MPAGDDGSARHALHLRSYLLSPVVALRCAVPYRIDLHDPPPDALNRLVELGALDVELTAGSLAAVMPDAVSRDMLASALGVHPVAVSPATGRDDDSVWILTRRPVHVGNLLLVPASAELSDEPGVLRLVDGPAFGTGLHPTTALCLEALEEELALNLPSSVLDVGTGSGVLALAALLLGVSQAVGLDIDTAALEVAAENARVNGLEERLQLVEGGPSDIDGVWPLVLANVLAAPLMDMAPQLVRRVGHRGRLMLSGISWSMASDVEREYQRFGMRHVRSETHAGWSVLILEASW